MVLVFLYQRQWHTCESKVRVLATLVGRERALVTVTAEFEGRAAIYIYIFFFFIILLSRV